MCENGHHWQNMAIFGASGAPRCHFLGALMAQTGHPGCVWQCPTLSNQCPTHLKPLEVPMCENGHHCQNLAIFWPKMGQKWWNLMGARLDITLFNQRKKLASLVFPKSKIFLTPPPLNTLCTNDNWQAMLACVVRHWEYFEYLKCLVVASSWKRHGFSTTGLNGWQSTKCQTWLCFEERYGSHQENATWRREGWRSWEKGSIDLKFCCLIIAPFRFL